MKNIMLFAIICVGLVGHIMGSAESKGLRSGHEHLKHYAKIAAKKDIRGSKKEITHKAKVAGSMLGTNAVLFGAVAGSAGPIGFILAGTALASMPLAAILIADAYGASPVWTAQLQLLATNKKSISKDKVLYMGVPVDQINEKLESEVAQSRMRFYKIWYYKKLRKAYLLSSLFNDIENVNKDNAYYLFLNPNDANLVNVFLALNNAFEKNMNDYKNKIAFLAMRPTPGITKAPSNGKNMPRIIIGFTPSVNKKDVEGVIRTINALSINGKNISEISLDVQPRYSQKITPWLYAAYGSADYKDSVKGKEAFANKAKGLWFWQSPSDEDMAYRDPSLAIMTSAGDLLGAMDKSLMRRSQGISETSGSQSGITAAEMQATKTEPSVSTKEKPTFKYEYKGGKKEIPTIESKVKSVSQ